MNGAERFEVRGSSEDHDSLLDGRAHSVDEDAVYVPAFAAEMAADKIALVARVGAALSVECTRVTADGAVMAQEMVSRFTDLVPQLHAAVVARAELAQLQPEVYEAGHYVWRQRHANRW